MRIFWLRFFAFSVLWALHIYHESNHKPLSILIFSVGLGLYFLLSMKRQQLILYLGLAFLLLPLMFQQGEGTVYTYLLLLYYLLDSGFRLQRKELAVYAAVLVAISLIAAAAIQEFHLDRLIIFALFFVLIHKVSQQTHDRQEQRALYEELLVEYRTLKRMNLDAERDARFQERTKIAREIHDSVGHRLTALIMKLEMLTIKERRDEYDELKAMAKESLEETRQAVKALQVHNSEGIATVVHLIRKLEAESHLLVQFTLMQGILSVPLSNDKSVALYRVIQESLTNAMRHSDSREVQVTLGRSATGDISFRIANTVHKPKPFTYGFGLSNMRKRVEEIEGKLSVYQTEKQFVVEGDIPGEEG